MLLAISLLLLQFLQISNADVSTCDTKNGPSGLSQCILSKNNYNGYQWATCLTDSYIKQKSVGKYHCDGGPGTFCWFECMREMYQSEGPDVTGICSCKPGDQPATNTLPSFCYTLTGSICKWYIDCLEATYPCNETEASNAVDYAYRFCYIYDQYYNLLSLIGRGWINAVRKCLQVSECQYNYINSIIVCYLNFLNSS